MGLFNMPDITQGAMGLEDINREMRQMLEEGQRGTQGMQRQCVNFSFCL